MGAANDCELLGAGFFGQPVNSVTTLALVVAGLVVVKHPRLRWVGAALIATGIGSFLFHGPMPAGNEWVHDVTLSWLILTVAGLDESWEKWTRLPGLAAIGIAFAIAPVAADPVAVVLTIIAMVLVLRRNGLSATIAPVALLAVVGILGQLGATGRPLCDPESLFQWHGLWHVGAAVGVAWLTIGSTREGHT